jgi:Fe-S cluster biogenesis protein NfuA
LDQVSAITREQVEQVIHEHVRPVMNAEGGDVRVEKVTADGSVTLCFTGRCAGCPGAELTLESLVTPFLTSKLPDVKKVVMVTWSLPLDADSNHEAEQPAERPTPIESIGEANEGDGTSPQGGDPALEPTLELPKVEALDSDGSEGRS